MKSAWMLTTSCGLLAILIGCTQPGLMLAPPAARPQANPQTLAPAATRPAAAPTTVARVEAEAGNDPAVEALTQKIEALAGHAPSATATQPAPAAPISPAPAAQVNAVQAPTTAPAAMPIAAAPAPAPAPVAQAPHAGPVAAPVAVPLPPAQPLGAPAASQPASVMVANAPTSMLPDTQKPATEIAASPAPRAVPTIQPSPFAPPQPSPAPMVTAEITDIRPVLVPPAAADPNASASANQPAQQGAQARAADLNAVISQLEQVIQQQPPHPEDELRLRLLYLAAGMDDKSSEPVKGMDPIQTELLGAIVKTVASSKMAMLQPTNASPNALNATEELRRLLGQQSGVSIPRIVLVTKVSSFGDYEQISPLRFKAGSDIHAYVYTEVANFRSEPVDGDRLRALLGERVQVFDSTGKVVWERNENNIEDRVRTPRRDFFIPFPLKLPATLAPGDYVLKVTVEDRIGGTTDQQRLTFSIQ